MNSNSLIGYRKVLITLTGMLFTWLISKGMPEGLASSLQGVVIEAIPIILSIAYMIFNRESKKLSMVANNQTTAPPPITAAAQPAPTLPPEQPATPEQPAVSRVPPVVDTMPGFTEADEVLTSTQKAMIAEWYSRAATKPPQVPVIPKEEATLYTDIKTRDERRFYQASNDIAVQAIAVFPGSDLDACLKLRKDCDERMWHRVNQHLAEARRRWISYGIALWQYTEL